MKNILVTMLISMIFFISANGQQTQFIPSQTHEIFSFRKIFEPKNDKIINYSLLDDDSKLLTVTTKFIQVWDIESAKLISETSHEISNNHTLNYSTVISPNSNYLLVFDRVYSETFPKLVKSKKTAAVIYDLRTGKLSSVLEGGLNSINYAFWSENGKTLMTNTELDNRKKEKEFCFLNGETLKYRNCFSVFGDVWWFKLSKDGTKFFTLVSNNFQNQGMIPMQNLLSIWDTENVKLIKKFSIDEKNYYTDDTFLNWDERFLSVGNTVFEVNGKDLPTFKTDNRIRGVSENGKYFFVKQKSGLQFYEFENSQPKYEIPKKKEDFRMNLLANERVLINQNLSRHCGRTEGFEIETGKKLWEMKLACHYESADCFFCSNKPNFNESIDFLSDGRYFLTSSEKAVRVWKSMTGELLQVLINPNQQIEKSKDYKFEDNIKGEKKVWSKNKQYIYFQTADNKSILQYELTKN